MIRAHFGLAKNPFEQQPHTLLAHQQEVHDILLVHCQQGGLCIVAGEPGTGKSVVKNHLQEHDKKRLITPTIGRTLHTYFTLLRILCQAFEIDYDGGDFKCEKRLIEQARSYQRQGKSIAILIDEAHLMETQALRKLRLLLEEFPRNHNLVLIAQPQIIDTLRLSSNQDIHSRITYSAILKPLSPEDIQAFILSQFDQCGLPHNILTEEALGLIARSSQGLLRQAKHLTLATLIETVRTQERTGTLVHVNRALRQPHWRQREALAKSTNT